MIDVNLDCQRHRKRFTWIDKALDEIENHRLKKIDVYYYWLRDRKRLRMIDEEL